LVARLGLTSRNSVTRNRARKIAISVPSTASSVVSVVTAVVVNVLVMNTGLGIEVVAEVVVLVSVIR
jgi:hypothetical protein